MSDARRGAAEPDRLIRAAAWCVIVALVITGLALGAPLLVPVAEAVLVWFVVNALADALGRARIAGRRLEGTAALWVAASIVVVLGIAAVFTGARSLASVGPQAINLKSSLDPLLQGIAVMLGTEEADVLSRAVDAIGVEAMMQRIVVGLIGLINQFGIVAIYVGFLLVDQTFFPDKLRVLVPDPERRARVAALIGDLRAQIGAYLWLMTRMSFLTAALSYVAMVLVGLDNPGFWATLIFVLNFVPTIGSILGTIIPAAFAMVQFGETGPALMLLVLVGIVQFGIGNVLMPRLAGQTLNLSLFVTVLSLFVWGSVWGVTGMFLAVPLTAILVLVAARFEATRPIAVALSRTGAVAPEAAPVPPGAAEVSR